MVNVARKNVAIIWKWYDADMILNEIGVIGHGNNTYCKANKSCDKIIDENTEYTKRLGFKITEKKKTLTCRYGISKVQVHVSSLHLK